MEEEGYCPRCHVYVQTERVVASGELYLKCKNCWHLMQKNELLEHPGRRFGDAVPVKNR
jgi:hypothetical protein